MNIHWRDLLIILYVLIQVRHVLRRTRVDEPRFTRIGVIFTNRKQVVARFVFDLRDACSLQSLPIRILADPHGTVGNPMIFLATAVIRSVLLHRSIFFALAMVTVMNAWLFPCAAPSMPPPCSLRFMPSCIGRDVRLPTT